MPRTDMATPSEVAAYLRTTEASLAQARYRGTGVPFIKVGRRVMYRWADVDAYLKSRLVACGERPGAA